MGLDLIGQRTNAVVLTLVFHDTGQRRLNIRIFDEQTHAATEFTLDAPGGRRDPVFDPVFHQQIPQRNDGIRGIRIGSLSSFVVKGQEGGEQ